MATPQTHIRSVSFPSRLHPINPTNFETQLQKLKSFQVFGLSKTVPISSEAIRSGLLGLAELYNSVQGLAQSPSKSMEDSALSGSVELLDGCSTIRELFQMIKENVQTLQSALRRKGLDSTIQNDVTTYFCFRKKMSKCVTKTLKKLKNLENNGSNLCVNADSKFSSVLRELTGVTTSIFKSILVFLSSPMSGTPRGWSLVSKLMTAKSSRENDDVVNEVRDVEFALSSLHGKMRSNGATVLDVQMLQKGLHNLDVVVQGFEGGLERLFRELLQTRVTLLNILTDL